MTQGSQRGMARVAFLAHLDTIKADLAAGWTVKATYERHQDRLKGAISYQHFAAYARQIRNGPPVSAARRPRQDKSAPPPPRPATPPTGLQKGSPPNAGLDRLRGKHEWNPEVTPEDRRRLLGEED